MSTDDLCGVWESCGDQRFRCRDDRVQPFWQWHVEDVDDARADLAFSPPRNLQSVKFVFEPTTVTDFIANFQLFLDAKRFASMHLDGN